MSLDYTMIQLAAVNTTGYCETKTARLKAHVYDTLVQ